MFIHKLDIYNTIPTDMRLRNHYIKIIIASGKEELQQNNVFSTGQKYCTQELDKIWLSKQNHSVPAWMGKGTQCPHIVEEPQATEYIFFRYTSFEKLPMCNWPALHTLKYIQTIYLKYILYQISIYSES